MVHGCLPKRHDHLTIAELPASLKFFLQPSDGPYFLVLIDRARHADIGADRIAEQGRRHTDRQDGARAWAIDIQPILEDGGSDREPNPQESGIIPYALGR